MTSVKQGMKLTVLGILTNVLLAIVKVFTGIVGNSYALIADGIESTSDILTSFITWNGLRIAQKPPDKNHPYGHGKAESLSSLIVSASLILAALFIAYNSALSISNPKEPPEWYTLPVLILVIVTKEFLSRRILKASSDTSSTALRSEAWHHRSDAITSAAAAIGITIGLIGGKEYASADDWAALLACTIIAYNGLHLLRPAINEVMDAAVDDDKIEKIRELASTVHGVLKIEKCRIRKSGTSLHMDIHVHVDPDLSVREGHEIGHKVQKLLLESPEKIADVVVHIEPANQS